MILIKKSLQQIKREHVKLELQHCDGMVGLVGLPCLDLCHLGLVDGLHADHVGVFLVAKVAHLLGVLGPRVPHDKVGKVSL